MKELNKKKEYKNIRTSKRNIVILSISLFLLVVLSTFIYKSFALFKISSEHVIIDAVVGNFYTGEEFSYTGGVQEFTVPVSAYYKIELWGANGMNAGSYKGGLGSYVSGNIELQEGDKLYFYIGGTPINNIGGYNGGGSSSLQQYNDNYARPGGGASDVRIVSGTWNETISLRSRIMIASGGGGACLRGAGYGEGNGGAGGGLIGTAGTTVNSSYGHIGNGGTQNTGGTVTSYNTTISGSDLILASGGFGYGANNSYNGGGSGYYGGGGFYHAGAGGGSSYISGYAGVNSVQESGGTSSQPLHTNNTIHYSGKYFLNGKMESGVNTGNGKAKITYVGQPQRTNIKLDNVRYIKSCVSGNSINNGKHWVEIQAIKDGVNVAYGKIVAGTSATTTERPYSRITDGDITSANYGESSNYMIIENSCITIDLGEEYNLDEIGLWLYWQDGRRYNDNVLSVGATNTSGTTSLSTVLHNYPGTTGYNETSQGRRYTAWD